MDHIGIDVHKNDSQLCVLTEHGKLTARQAPTEAARLAEILGLWPRARIRSIPSSET